MPTVNLDTLDLSTLRQRTVALVNIGTEYQKRLGSFVQGQEKRLLDRGQAALKDLLAEIDHLGLPLEFRSGDFRGNDEVCSTVQTILFAADNLKHFDPFAAPMDTPVLLPGPLAQLKDALDLLGKDTAVQYVTLDQAAVIVNHVKRTLERAIHKPGSGAPPPDIKGGGGRSHEWVWSNLRPWLEKTFHKKLPERFPSFVPPS
jgi:hypothetical protein